MRPLAKKGIHASRLERGAHRYYRDGERNIVIHSRVDLLAARKITCPQAGALAQEMAKFLRLERRGEEFERCGAHVGIAGKDTRDTWANAEKAVEYLDISPTRNKCVDELATAEELSAFRNTNGQIQWLARRSRPDIAFEQIRRSSRWLT